MILFLAGTKSDRFILFRRKRNETRFTNDAMKAKIAYEGEWVRVANMRNKHFAAGYPCELCKKLTAGTVWYSIKSHAVRCMKCFAPKGFEQ